MSSVGVALHGFAYGEHLEGVPARSLGYRLLAPVEPEPWAAEVEALARRLQAAPYPDHWPTTELFCSVLLKDGERLIGLARYGLEDHTASRRRGGVELFGIVGPGSLGMDTALAIYRWLRERRREASDLYRLGRSHDLAEILATQPTTTANEAAAPAMPFRLWQAGALLIAATTPVEPDERLELLKSSAASNWQWLPWVGADFPLATYAERGPLIAWSAPLAGTLRQQDPRLLERNARQAKRRYLLQGVLGLALVLLLAANLWAVLSRGTPAPATVVERPEHETPPLPAAKQEPAGRSPESFILALHDLLEKHKAAAEWTQNQLIDRYQTEVAREPGLTVATVEGKAAVGAISVLSGRTAVRIEALIRDALRNKGYDPELVDLVCRRIREHLTADIRDTL
jgi:hypothetical protein